MIWFNPAGNVDPCSNSRCAANGGTCHPSMHAELYTCVCAVGTTGFNCEEDLGLLFKNFPGPRGPGWMLVRRVQEGNTWQ